MQGKKGKAAGCLTIANLIFGIFYYKSARDTQQSIDELCGTITLSSIGASSRLDEALEADDRRLALMAGIELEQLSGLLKSSAALDLSPIGRADDSTPFSAGEIAVIEEISAGLKELALSFYSESVTETPI